MNICGKNINYHTLWKEEVNSYVTIKGVAALNFELVIGFYEPVQVE